MGKQAAENNNKNRKVSDDELQKIVDRLHKTHTISSRGDGGGKEPTAAKDTISAENSDVNLIVQRLYTTHTKAMHDHEDLQLTARDTISKAPVQSGEADAIVTRLYVTHTKSSSGGGPQPKVCDNSVAKNVESEEELQEIYSRLNKTHTKSSSGGVECRPFDPLKDPGFGLKMYPVVEGIETRFAGQNSVPPTEELSELNQRMMKTQTTCSQARLDNARILLYPERTTLMNDVDRIRTFQDSGSLSKQAALQRREKWFN